MKRQRRNFLLPVLATVSLSGWFAVHDATAQSETETQVQSQSQPVGADVSAQFSGPARDVVKMATSGVADDVLTSYIQNSSSTFNLTSDGIIQLQQLGISGAVTTAMLSHDKALIDNATSASAPAPPIPSSVPTVSDEGAPPQDQSSAPPQSYDFYNDLLPYGSWYYVGNYGWCWQPYNWVGYAAYPWGLAVLPSGHWWNHPERGWLWFPTARSLEIHTGSAGQRVFAIGQNRALPASQPFIIHNSATFNHGFPVTRPFVHNFAAPTGRRSGGMGNSFRR